MLSRFLQVWLGTWPAPGAGLTVVGSPARDKPRWDGAEQPALGVTDANGRGVLSVSPAHRDSVAALVEGLGPVSAQAVLTSSLPGLLGRPGHELFTGVFRWTATPPDLPGAGTWEPPGSPGLPEWLLPFPGNVLIARDPTGAYLAGVGLKPHDVSGVEISVGTAERARGQGLARRLVARATRRIVAGGAVALYLHDPGNHASARVAEAAGFPDAGWRIHAVA